MRLRNVLYTSFILTALCSIVYILRESKKPESILRERDTAFKFIEGDTQWHSLNYQVNFRITNPLDYNKSDQSNFAQAEITANMFSKVLKVTDKSAWLFVQLQNADCTSEISKNPKCMEVYESPFLIKMSLGGFIEQYQFPNSLSASEEEKLASLIEPLNVAENSENIKVLEQSIKDSLGTALVRYTYQQTGIEKKKLDYIRLKDKSGYIDQADIENSYSIITPSSVHSWFDNLNSKEIVTLKQQGKNQLLYEVDIDYSTIKTSKSLPELANKGLDEIRISFNKNSKREHSRYDEFTLASEKQTEENKNLDLKAISLKLDSNITPGERIKILSGMADHYRTLPNRTKEISDLILNSDTSDTTRGDLFYVLQSTETIESQNILLDLSDNSALSVADQKRAIVSLSFMQLEAYSIEKLWQIYQTEDTPEFKQRAQVALLALGTSSDIISEKNPEESKQILDKMQNLLEQSSSMNQIDKTEDLLLALGNSRNEKSAEIISAYLNSESDRIRKTAAQAIEVSGKEEYKAQLSHQLLEEESNDTRSAIIDTLLEFEPSKETLALSVQSFTEEDEVRLRIKLANYFIKASQAFPESRKAFTKLMESEPDPQVYELLARASVGSK